MFPSTLLEPLTDHHYPQVKEVGRRGSWVSTRIMTNLHLQTPSWNNREPLPLSEYKDRSGVGLYLPPWKMSSHSLTFRSEGRYTIVDCFPIGPFNDGRSLLSGKGTSRCPYDLTEPCRSDAILRFEGWAENDRHNHHSDQKGFYKLTSSHQ